MTRTSAVVLATAVALAAADVQSAKPAPDARTIVHVLSRVTFGPRPADAARVREVGVERYLDEQLHPERIADEDAARRLRAFETLGLSSREIAEQYELPALRAAANSSNGGTARRIVRLPAIRRCRQGSSVDASRPRCRCWNCRRQKIVRATYSERQLQEVLADFWFNHFNVDARKGPSRFLLTEYEREAIRPHVLGRFRDLLGATANSPAMLFYLDNWMSADPEAASRGAMRERAGRTKADGPERKLRAGAARAAHARCGRRLHAERRHRGGPCVHRVDDCHAARGRTLPLRARVARRSGEGGPRTPDQGQRRPGGRRGGARLPGGASVDRDVRRHQARAPVRQRHATRIPRRTGWPPRSAGPTAICAP